MKKIFQEFEEVKRLIKLQTSINKNVLTIEEASLLTGLKISTLYKYVSENQIPSYKPQGKRLFFKRTELENWLLRNKQKSNYELENEVRNEMNKKNRNL
jgi:excisionase family DNA binding protein